MTKPPHKPGLMVLLCLIAIGIVISIVFGNGFSPTGIATAIGVACVSYVGLKENVAKYNKAQEKAKINSKDTSAIKEP